MGLKPFWRGKDRTDMQNYLLGNLTGTALENLEERLLLDDAVFADMLAAEEELIESFLNGELHGTALRQFEAAFLASGSRRDRVEQHRLSRIALGPSPRKASAPQRNYAWIASAAALALTVAAGFLAISYRQRWLQSEHDLLAAHATQSRYAPMEISYRLDPGRLRSQSQRQWIWIAPGAQRVSFLLAPPEIPLASPFLARLETVEGAQVWAGPCTEIPGQLTLTVPAAVLRPGDYILMLERGGLSVASYPLRVLVR